jgi:iron complex transport system substrate-binding protein
MRKLYFCLSLFIITLGCSEIKKTPSIDHNDKQILNIKYANSFNINYFDNYKIIEIINPWPDSEETYTYALAENGTVIPPSISYDAIIEIPVSTIVVTSTTHIPSLEMLNVSQALVGFPNLDYISSEKTRARIADGEIVELGKNEDINTEVLIDLAPDLVVGFAVDGNNKAMSTIKKTGIPVVYNADWTETTPLGKAEWIKFFGALFNKEKEADSIFNKIERQYNSAKQLAAAAKNKPSVLSGAMYKDIWYLPQGNSWAAQFIKDAHGDYLWKESEGTGSLSLNLESVLEKGQLADVWIGPGQFTNLQQMKDTHSVYSEFDAFKNGEVYSFTTKKGETGGVLYYELAPNRPDLVLMDIIKILHPNLLLEHESYFFNRLE